MNLLMQPTLHANKRCEMVANGGNVLVESLCQFAEPRLLLLARQTDQALECFLPFLAFVFGPLVGSLLFAFLFALLALLLTSNRKFMASGFGLCVACLFLAVLDDRRDHVFQDGTRYAQPFSAAVDPQPPLSGR